MKITIFYSIRTGRIMSYCIAEVGQDMNFFGTNKEDFEMIYDFVVFDYTEEYQTVLNNRDIFYIDIETKVIKQNVLQL